MSSCAQQVASLVVWFGTIAGFYALFVPILPSYAWQVTTTALYTVTTAAILCAYLVVSLTNPADETADGPLFCDRCQAFVQRGSRHCRECNKCVLGFDHHCKWVNNCIGAKNYHPFLGLLTSTCAMLVTQLTAGLVDLAYCFKEADAVNARLQSVYAVPISREGYITALCIYLSIIVLALYSLGDLWLLHLVLIARGMTTYDYIMANHDMKVAAAAAAAETAGFGANNSHISHNPVLGSLWHNLKSLGPRSRRVLDESVLLPSPQQAAQASTSGSNSGSSGTRVLVMPCKKHRVSLTPCEACLTPQGAIDARQHALAYQQPPWLQHSKDTRHNSAVQSPRTTYQNNMWPGTELFDAAASGQQQQQHLGGQLQLDEQQQLSSTRSRVRWQPIQLSPAALQQQQEPQEHCAHQQQRQQEQPHQQPADPQGPLQVPTQPDHAKNGITIQQQWLEPLLQQGRCANVQQQQGFQGVGPVPSSHSEPVHQAAAEQSGPTQPVQVLLDRYKPAVRFHAEL